MSVRQRPRLLALFFLLVTGLSLLGLGVAHARRQYLTRGIPEGFPQEIKHGGVQPGINVYLSQYDDEALAENLGQIRDAGFSAVKQPFFFAEPYDWAESDRLVDAVASSGLLLVPLLDGNPQTKFTPPADPATFSTWASEFARRYRSQIDAYVIWDEPNLASHWGEQPVNPAEYAALLTASAEAIRIADAGAVIVAAPLAPTVEMGPMNLADPRYLQSLYEAGAADAFDVVAAKPYGFDKGPEDRTVATDTLNFSRVILLREVMDRHGDGHKAIWAGNWGWNALPPDWQGAPSIWGQAPVTIRAEWTVGALERAQKEWPWMGFMFLENWQPAAQEDDPRWGFSIAGRETALQMKRQAIQADIAYPGYHPARDADLAQSYRGSWRFSPEFGADISQSGDSVSFRFWGTDVGLRVRRANFRARLYLTVDGRPANALPHDENGATLVLTAADPNEDYITTEAVALDLSPGPHTLTIVANRGWGQWALAGFSVGYRPPADAYRLTLVTLGSLALASLLLGLRCASRAQWGGALVRLSRRFRGFSRRYQVVVTALTAALVAITGWLMWGIQAGGLYRRLDDASQLALTAAAASLFYITPWFVVYMAALTLLFFLIAIRPTWGLALVAFSFPFYVRPKPMLGYRFSPVEMYLLVTLAAVLMAALSRRLAGTGQSVHKRAFKERFLPTDYASVLFTLVATLSLFFTQRLDVATNEWRVVIVEPFLFYLLLRWSRIEPGEMRTILNAFILGGFVVAAIGLTQVVTGQQLITAEAGALRLRSIYGSPNNVALYLGRVFPLAAALALMGQGKHRLAYAAALVSIFLAMLLTLSKGGLFLGIPVASLVVLFYWRRLRGRQPWLWIVAASGLALIALLVSLQIPQLAERLNPQGATGFFRLNLWRASLNMLRDHPVFGVGLDNFLYAYRGRYIFDAAWQEPGLSHPHNIALDFATRLGILGLVTGTWLVWAFWQVARGLPAQVSIEWQPVAVGLMAAMAYVIAHGLVDHSFFLVDLAFAFYLLLGTAAWLHQVATRP